MAKVQVNTLMKKSFAPLHATTPDHDEETLSSSSDDDSSTSSDDLQSSHNDIENSPKNAGDESDSPQVDFSQHYGIDDSNVSEDDNNMETDNMNKPPSSSTKSNAKTMDDIAANTALGGNEDSSKTSVEADSTQSGNNVKPQRPPEAPQASPVAPKQLPEQSPRKDSNQVTSQMLDDISEGSVQGSDDLTQDVGQQEEDSNDVDFAQEGDDIIQDNNTGNDISNNPTSSSANNTTVDQTLGNNRTTDVPTKSSAIPQKGDPSTAAPPPQMDQSQSPPSNDTENRVKGKDVTNEATEANARDAAIDISATNDVVQQPPMSSSNLTKDSVVAGGVFDLSAVQNIFPAVQSTADQTRLLHDAQVARQLKSDGVTNPRIPGINKTKDGSVVIVRPQTSFDMQTIDAKCVQALKSQDNVEMLKNIRQKMQQVMQTKNSQSIDALLGSLQAIQTANVSSSCDSRLDDVAKQLMAVLNKWMNAKNSLADATGRAYRNKRNIRKTQEQLESLKAQTSSLEASVRGAETNDAKVSSDCAGRVKSLLPELYARIDRIVDLHSTLSGN